MFGFFKSKSNKIYDQIVIFKDQLEKEIDPFLEEEKYSIKRQAAFIALALNISFYFVGIRNNSLLHESSSNILKSFLVPFGDVVSQISRGAVSPEQAATSLLSEIGKTKQDYFLALDKSATEPESSLQECLDIFLKSAGDLSFKSEMERSLAVIALSRQIKILMDKFRTFV